MKQGSFIDAILINGSEAGNVQLINVLNDAINQTLPNAQELLFKLDIRVINQDYMNNDTINWDLIVLDYKLSSPLSIIVSEKKEYLRMFNYLFKFKRLGYQLNRQWNENNYIHRLTQDDEKLQKTLKKLHILRNEFLKFIGVLTNFINLNIIDKNFDKLIKKLEKRETKITLKLAPIPGFKLKSEQQKSDLFELQELINLHSAYIRSITRHKLFTQNELTVRVNNLVIAIENFIKVNDEINLLCANLFTTVPQSSEYNEYKEKIVERVKQNDWVDMFDDELGLLISELVKDDQSQDLKILGLQLS
ncbi:unnamed protein product [Ambrosiozyma monospora]|uniref:Unnamed protein product n=1 Tax=Ambrosiozyma monospora TaxID=43982 RepID=A0ACB5T1Y3_AMBMO|nr:unnamed protein product [Ambrosiozyma monospora]